MINIKTKKIFLISDIHLGYKNNSNEWYDIQKGYFDNFFIPTVKSKYEDGDSLFILGDLFHSRTSIHQKTMNYAVDLFNELIDIFDDKIYVLLGNHDVCNKTNNDINALKPFEWNSNITIFKEPEVIKVNDKTILMMPWRTNVVEELKTIDEYGIQDYLFCHTEFAGMLQNQFSKVDKKGLDSSDINRFDRVVSGHIHISQELGNVLMLGSPYGMDFGDTDNDKFLHIFNPNTNEVSKITNTYSPKYIRIDLDEVNEMTIEELNSIFDNNFVEVYCNTSKWLGEFPQAQFCELINVRDISFLPYTNEKVSEVEDTYTLDEKDINFDIPILIKSYIESNVDDSIKIDVIKKFNELNKKFSF